MRLLVDDSLRSAFVHVSVRLQLEQQVQDVDDQQDNAGTTADFQDLSVCKSSACRFERGIEGSLRDAPISITSEPLAVKATYR